MPEGKSTSAEPFAAFVGLGRALRWLREDRRLKQFELARAAGITRPMLSAYERDRQRPALETLEKILSGLNCDLAELAVVLKAARSARGSSLATPALEAPRAVAVAPSGGSTALPAPAPPGTAAGSSEETAFRDLLRALMRWRRAVWEVEGRTTR